jgi:prepilin-type N-terminal cleavage/methylation domain-containing protein
MKKTSLIPNDSKGFTLVELIITLMLITIVGATMVQYMDLSLSKSPEPVNLLRNQQAIIEEMETLTGYYRKEVIDEGNLDLNTFKANYVDTSTYVDAANTGLINLSGGGYTTSAPILKVTLRYGDQRLVSLFTTE